MSASRRALLLFLSIAVVGCGNAHGTIADWFGATDRADPAPLTSDILCDASAGSTCNEQTLREAVDAALHAAANRPGSAVRVWLQGGDVESTRLIAEARSEKSRITGRRARAEHESHWIKSELATISAAAAKSMRKPAHRSPIAESIGVAALAPVAPNSVRELTVISDGMEVSGFGEFECGPLPKPERFAGSLARNRVLPPGSLTNVAVRFCHFDLGGVDRGRCAASLYRAAQIRAIWQNALAAAGASSIDIRQGGLDPTSAISSGKDSPNAPALQSR
jgi:hypothetical protein